MASRRKSTVPCMVRSTEAVVQEGSKDPVVGKAAGLPEQNSGDVWSGTKENCENDCEVIEGKSSPANPVKKLLGGYECKYCPYSSQNLNEFTEHIDTQHPNVILNPLYVCAECNYKTKKYDSLSEHNAKLHPGENNFKLKLMKLNNQTILAQSIEASTNNPVASEIPEIEVDPFGASVTNKTPNASTGKSKGEAKKPSLDSHFDGFRHLVTETSVPITCINTADLLQDVLAHVMPSVQLPPNINLVPKVPVPLNTTKYNSALDTNATMISSFNKFPYPTQAELSWLTAASKHPEEQIRIWFATQRLKHGISWSPEEVEEARKKMFNGTIQPTAPQTITVLPAHVTPAKMPQPIIQAAVPCQILGQTGLVLTQVSNGSSVTPITLTVTANQGQKRCAPNPPAAPEVKRSHVVPVETQPKQNPPAPPAVTPAVPPPAMPVLSASDRKKTKNQIAVLKASFLINQFPDETEIYRLIEMTGLPKSEIKKWFSDHRYRSQRGIVNITSESVAKDQIALAAVQQGYTYDPALDIMTQKFKDKNQEQLGILEESFLRNSFPTQSELDRLRIEAKMNRTEVDYYFTERRKLRDNMEQAVLDSMRSSIRSQEGTSNGAVSQMEHLNISQAPLSLSRRAAAFSPYSQEQVHLLKSTFAKTRWPSPQEYDELAAQTGLTRTEIVRWFKDNRNSLTSGTLKWLDQYQQQYVVDGYREPKAPIPFAVTKTSSNAIQQPHKEFPKLGRLNREGMDRSECNSQDSQGNEDTEEGDDVSWVEVTIDDDYTTSDGMDSSSQTVPEVKVEYDPESISGDNSHT
ncbi:zinc fingers and homeoboxes protein 2 [Heteronotia binoei]|uniref:zinc fingers and homeoboxes protein 2 n=1 Tax=Heteronotia binoei TaxID=13085 RepID=UPI002931DE51|nr:zinc fingers and homeoboxes protein 2 [Heteronotia binoei]XP_060099234.1 zinc fingers and homeoboxes protein 2 [Heteronotia binoei]